MTTLRTVQKAMRVLLEISRCADIEAGVTELSNQLGYPKAVIHRILATLVKEGFVEQDAATRKYSIGSRAFEVGIKYRVQDKLVAIAEPYLKAMMDRLDRPCSCYVGVLDDTAVVFLKAYFAPKPIKIDSAQQGDRRRVHTTALGKALLAALPTTQFDALVDRFDFSPLTKNTIRDAGVLREEIELIKLRGYAIADQESLEGVTAVGAAMVPSRLNLSGISASIPSISNTDGLVATLGKTVQSTAFDIGRAIRQYIDR